MIHGDRHLLLCTTCEMDCCVATLAQVAVDFTAIGKGGRRSVISATAGRLQGLFGTKMGWGEGGG
jgi:hypothetical protein